MANTPRTTADQVIAVLTPGQDYDLINNPDLTRQIKAASLTVDRIAACATTKGLTLSTEELTEIETWLAAHRYCISDKTYQSKSTGPASASFTGQTGKGCEATLYGQEALRLDYSGCLEAIDKRKFASAAWLGKSPTNQRSLEERGY